MGTEQEVKAAFFDAASEPMVTCKTPGPGKDILEASANNLYVNVSSRDLEGFTERFGLNSRLVKQSDGTLVEEVYRVGGKYHAEISRIVEHLADALPYASPTMRRALEALIRWYTTGDDADRAAYDIAWVEDKDSTVDTINGFIEVYLDARGIKGAWEALVYFVNRDKTAGIEKGDLIPYRDDAGREVNLKLVGKLPMRMSVFQGTVLISAKNFTELWPSREGFRAFLIDAPAEAQFVRALAQMATVYSNTGESALAAATVIRSKVCVTFCRPLTLMSSASSLGR